MVSARDNERRTWCTSATGTPRSEHLGHRHRVVHRTASSAALTSRHFPQSPQTPSPHFSPGGTALRLGAVPRRTRLLLRLQPHPGSGLGLPQELKSPYSSAAHKRNTEVAHGQHHHLVRRGHAVRVLAPGARWSLFRPVSSGGRCGRCGAASSGRLRGGMRVDDTAAMCRDPAELRRMAFWTFIDLTGGRDDEQRRRAGAPARRALRKGVLAPTVPREASCGCGILPRRCPARGPGIRGHRADRDRASQASPAKRPGSHRRPVRRPVAGGTVAALRCW